MKTAYEIQIEKINANIAKQVHENFENFKKTLNIQPTEQYVGIVC